MNKTFHRIIDWIMGPNPRCHLLVIRNDGKVLMKIDLRTVMAINELNGRQTLILDLDGNCKIRVNDNLSWTIECPPERIAGIPIQGAPAYKPRKS